MPGVLTWMWGGRITLAEAAERCPFTVWVPGGAGKTEVHVRWHTDGIPGGIMVRTDHAWLFEARVLAPEARDDRPWWRLVEDVRADAEVYLLGRSHEEPGWQAVVRFDDVLVCVHTANDPSEVVRSLVIASRA